MDAVEREPPARLDLLAAEERAELGRADVRAEHVHLPKRGGARSFTAAWRRVRSRADEAASARTTASIRLHSALVTAEPMRAAFSASSWCASIGAASLSRRTCRASAAAVAAQLPC